MRRFLLEALDPPSLVHHCHPKLTTLGDRVRHRADGDLRTLFQMVTDHLAHIHKVYVICPKYQDQIRLYLFDEIDILIDRISRPQIPALTYAHLSGDGQDKGAPHRIGLRPSLL